MTEPWHLKYPGGRNPRSGLPRVYGTAAYFLARLERDGHNKLAAEVRAGKISAHAAAVRLGWRKRPVTFSAAPYRVSAFDPH
jgi:hypothetical protein